jgi:NAD-dependent dihydropyrimidine dehydrogenase PreA subunit
MSVIRYDLNKCIGCRTCITLCPMDVFRFNEKANKSVIAYPDNCQSCGQCFINCPGRSLSMSNYDMRYEITNYR